MKWWLRWLAVSAGLWAGSAAAAGIWVVADPDDAYHRSLAADLQARSWHKGAALAIHSVTEAIPAGGERPDLVITLGETAAARKATWPGPLLHAFITEPQFHALYPEGAPKDHSALFLEQPLDRYVALVRAGLPRVKRLVVPVAVTAQSALLPLHRAAEAAGLSVREQAVASPEELDDLLVHADPVSDALLFLPDPALRSNTMIKVALVGAYKRRLPVIAYSEGLAMAGALAAVHTTVPLLGDEISAIANGFLDRGDLSPPSHPTRFDVSVNYQLAKSLNLRIPAKSLLLQQIREVSHGR